VKQVAALGLEEVMFIICFSFWQENYWGRFQVSVFRCQEYEPDKVENYQIPQSIVCLLTPDT
jgi:hypothetical protein